MEETVALGLFFFLLIGHFLLFDLNMVFVGKPTECFGVGIMLVVHEESNSVARFATAEAFVNTFGGGDVEGGSFFVVERAAANMVGTPFF